MSCLKKERKPMVPLKTLDIIFRRRYVPNTQHYFANRQHAVSKDKPPTKPGRPFLVPKTEKLLSYIKYSDRVEKNISKRRLSQPLHKKDNLRIAATRDISKRLFIEEVPDDVRAVVEIHPEFYTVIEGRPLRSFDDIKVYVNNIRSYAMNRQQIGYRRDLIIKIDQGLIDESKEYDIIAANLKQHLKDFQKFLTEDYKKACLKVSKAEKAYTELVAMNSEFLGYVSILTVLNNILFKLEAIRSTLKIYRRYLMFVAPLSWRQKNDENLKNKIQSIQFETGEFATDNDLVETPDIDKMVENARIELSHPLLPKMFFETPEQMIYLFRTMELQSREYLNELSKTDAPFRMLQDRIKQLKLVTKKELDHFQFYIETINHEIAREQHNEIHLQENFYRILNDSFYASVASPSVLKLKICIEFVYEEIFGKCEEGHQSLQDPMKILEITYEDYNLRLDALDFKIVNQARSDFFAQDLKMMINAYKAQRELRAFREMTNAMNKAFLPPGKFKRPVLKKFMDKKSRIALALTQKKNADILAGDKRKIKRFKKITQEEREGLLLFTDWCEGMNPAPYLKEYYDYVIPTFAWMPLMEDDVHSFIVNISKPRAFVESPIRNLLSGRTKRQSKKCTRKSSDKSFKKFSLPDNKPLEIVKLRNEQLFLPYRIYAKRQETDLHKARLRICIYDKYKIFTTDLKRRLHVDEITDDVCAIADLDDTFYSFVNGRHLPYHIPLYKSIKPILDSIFRMQLEVSYKNDCILKIEVNMRKELETYELSIQRCKDQARHFDSFISEDYLKSMAFLDKWEQLKSRLNLKIAELHSLASDKFTIMSRLVGLDYKFCVLQKYGRFLYYLSPPGWRLNNREFARSIEIEEKGFDLGHSSEEDPFVVIFEKLKQQCYDKLIKPALYFNRPSDLMKVFEIIEEQQLHYLTHITYLSPHTVSLKKAMKCLKYKVSNDSYSVINMIKGFEKVLHNSDSRSEFLEAKFNTIVNGFFYDNVGAPDVLKLCLHLEFCYEKVCGEQPFNLDMMTTAKALENCYMDYSKRIDSIHADSIKRAVKRSVDIENQKFKNAKTASRELRVFEKLKKELIRSCLPSSRDNFIPLLPGKKILPCKKVKDKKSVIITDRAVRRSLSVAEQDYLTLFTDWVPGEDPAEYLQSLHLEDQSTTKR